MKPVRDIIIESPGIKTVFSSALAIASGVLSGTFVTEITTSSGIAWLTFYKAYSFYGLLVLMVVIYFYNRATYLYERNIRNFSDDDYCIAYMRSKCLPEAAEKYKAFIREGRGGELRQAMDELKKILR